MYCSKCGKLYFKGDTVCEKCFVCSDCLNVFDFYDLNICDYCCSRIVSKYRNIDFVCAKIDRGDAS